MKGPVRMGGGRMLRVVGRAVGAGLGGGVQEAVSTAAGAASGPGRHAKSAGVVSVSSSSSSGSSSFATSASERISLHQPLLHFCDGDGWESIGEEEIAEADDLGFARRFVFGPAPSREEVVDAVSTIQQTFAPFTFPQDFEDHFSAEAAGRAKGGALMGDSVHAVSSSDSEPDWIEPTLHVCRRAVMDSEAHEKVVNAFRLLQANPSVKRTVVSLSLDKAVWDAVMKNEAVQELRESFLAAENAGTSDDDEQNLPAKILRVFRSTKERMMELVEKIAGILGGLFSTPEKGRKADLFDEALRSSFMLSVVVFIVVMISRSLRA